jgi:hypothetical protein
MNRLLTACAFAAAIILLALGISNGVVDRDAGETMLIVLPILAVTSFASGGCRRAACGVRS